MLGANSANNYTQANEITSAGHSVFHMSSTLLFLTVLCSLAKYTFFFFYHSMVSSLAFFIAHKHILKSIKPICKLIFALKMCQVKSIALNFL